MRKRSVTRLVAALAVFGLIAAACGDDDDGDTAAEDTTTTEAADTDDTEAAAEDGGDGLRIGYVLPQSGQLEFLGPPMINGVELAEQEVNDAGGVNGEPIQLIAGDSGTDPDVANATVDDLLADDVDAIVGPAASGIALSVIDKITTAGIPMCSPSNTGVQFTTYDDSDLYFRTAPPDNLQAQVLADLVVNDGATNVVVLGRSDEYGEGFANFVTENLTDAGVTVADTIIYDQDAGTFTDVATQIAGASPDAVVMISFDEGGQIIQDAIGAGVGPDTVQWYGADGMQSSTFFELVDPNDPSVVEGIKGTAPSAAPAGGEETFRERFEDYAPGVDTIFSGHAYDCVVILSLAAEKAGSNDPAEIAANVNDVTRPDGEECTLVDACLELVAGGDDVNYEGAAGPLDFVDAGEPGAGEYDTWTFAADGSVEVIEESIEVQEGG